MQVPGLVQEQLKGIIIISNMKHHSTLCDYVSQAESDTLWLQTLRNVVDETHSCGEHSCTACVQHVLEWILGQGLLTFGDAIFGLFVLFTLTVQLQCVSRRARRTSPSPSSRRSTTGTLCRNRSRTRCSRTRSATTARTGTEGC